MALEQEKQARTRKKQEKTSVKQEQTQENKNEKKPLTIHEAKKAVFDLVQHGMNYREIAKHSFMIEGLGLKRYSISEINKIKNEFLGNRNDPSNSDHSKTDKPKIFRLLEKGT
ncbi:MAG: hypothetical protein KGL95_04465 [Patescibacteria group bacterium]|nr:hypothetical protein [Patescibacteria group bacterium]